MPCPPIPQPLTNRTTALTISQVHIRNKYGEDIYDGSQCYITDSGSTCTGTACTSSSNNNCAYGPRTIAEEQRVCAYIACDNESADCNVDAFTLTWTSSSLMTTGSCTAGSECASGSCKQGQCCTSKGMTAGCTDCWSDGDCKTCSSGYTRTDHECVADCSTSAHTAHTDVLDFQTASGTAFWQNTGFSSYWTCSDSWCRGLTVTASTTSAKGALFSATTSGLKYSGHKYYIRTTFTDTAGATAAEAAEIKLSTGTSNCDQSSFDTAALQAIPMTKFYDNVCDNPGYRAHADESDGKYEASYGPFYKDDTICFVYTCSASECLDVVAQYGIYM